MMRYVFLFFSLLTALVAGEGIADYNVLVKVLQSGNLEITEQIHYDFGDMPHHGILRDIPATIKTKHSWHPVDLGFDNFEISRDEMAARWKEMTISSDTAGRMIRLKTGDSYTALTGLHIYQISYRVKKGVLPGPNGTDAIRWNVVGTGWNVPIGESNIFFSLPKSLKRSNVKIRTFLGGYNSTTGGPAPIWKNDHYFMIHIGKLQPHEGVTVEVAYPKALLGETGEGNVTPTASEKVLENWPLPVLATFVLSLLALFKRLGGEKHVGPVPPQYYPPKDLSLLQSGLLLDKFADKEDFTAAVLELASKGYLEIFNEEERYGSPYVKRLKPSDEQLTEDQRYLMDHLLFEESDTFVFSRADRSRAGKVNKVFDTIDEALYEWSVSGRYMWENPKKLRSKFLWISISLLLVVLGLSLYATVVVLLPDYIVYLDDIAKLPLRGLLITPVFVLPVGIVAIWYFYRKIGPFTQKGLTAHRYLLGYKDFMEEVEQDRIRRFLEEDPNYLDKGLPYAVLFGLERYWMKFYDIFHVSPPVWYNGNLDHFNDFDRNVSSQIDAPASESGGFGGGGGFSGGGGGGGGGSSW